MQDSKINRIDYDGIAEDLIDIILENLDIHHWEDRDEDGVHVGWEVYPSHKQKELFIEKLRLFCISIIETYVNNMFATEDAKRIHYE